MLLLVSTLSPIKQHFPPAHLFPSSRPGSRRGACCCRCRRSPAPHRATRSSPCLRRTSPAALHLQPTASHRGTGCRGNTGALWRGEQASMLASGLAKHHLHWVGC